MSGGEIAVVTGEEFGILRSDHGSSGYRADVITPPGMVHLGSGREAAAAFGAAVRVVERFICRRSGSYRVDVVESRPWESEEARTSTIVNCR